MAPSNEDGRERGRDRDKPLYMISVAAELTGMHPQTLRVYEQKGLVTPGRSRGNTRLYSQADIERLNLISKLTDEGINLAGVVRILDMRERMLDREAELDELRARVRKLEDEVHEYKMQEKITALARYDAAGSPEQVMRRLLLGGAQDEKNDD
ncbi:heat shock protein transcriptional repressor HspR [Thermophilibacter sp.]|uniref:heat shock protein transcriptional repressor HspR n=1 Tax=Thermophilibacter sp. TaxID=2847309 RepID=UPI003A9025F0